MKRIISLFLAAILLLSLFGCSDVREFRHCEMILRLPRDFSLVEEGEPFVISDGSGKEISFTTSNEKSVDMALCDGNCAVTLVRISTEAAAAAGIFPALSQLEFAKFYIERILKLDALCQLISDIPYCTYEKRSNGTDFSFLLSFFRTPNAYFVLSFITTADRFDAMMPTLTEYVVEVKFGE